MRGGPISYGEVTERLKVVVSKTTEPVRAGSVGSNPTLSADGTQTFAGNLTDLSGTRRVVR